MPHRDPVTGQFVSTQTDQFNDIEVATFQGTAGVQAADLAGTTGFGGETNSFDGLELIDYDEFVDRNETLVLLQASHELTLYANSTESEDGTVVALVEVSADPARIFGVSASTSTITGNVVGNSGQDDSIDFIGRPLFAMAGAPFSDTATGIGGAGTEGRDSWQSTVFPAEFGRFHPRDELFLNGQFRSWNIDDAGVHLHVVGQHTYGVIAE